MGESFHSTGSLILLLYIFTHYLAKVKIFTSFFATFPGERAYNKGNGKIVMTIAQEKALIATICEGDTEQYRYFVERYHRGLIQHVFNFTRDGDLAEDIAQEAFIRAYIKLAQYNDDYAFSTWLYKIADNLTKRHLAKTRHTVDIADFEDIISDPRPPTDELIDSAFDRTKVQQAVLHLTPDYRRVIIMYYWDNLQYDEIADILERPVGTIRTWLYRAKEQLRKDLTNGQT